MVDLSLAELRELRGDAVPDDELRRAKDHLKGSLMLSLESTSSRMSHLARQNMAFGRHFTLDEMLGGDRSGHGRRRAARRGGLFQDGAPVATVVGPKLETAVDDAQLEGLAG